MRIRTTTDAAGRTMDVLREHTYTCTEDGANKFWTASLCRHLNPQTGQERSTEWLVRLTWGKIGTVGQLKETRYRTEHLASAYLEGRLRDKERKGYIPGAVTTPVAAKVATKVGLVDHVETEWDIL